MLEVTITSNSLTLTRRMSQAYGDNVGDIVRLVSETVQGLEILQKLPNSELIEALATELTRVVTMRREETPPPAWSKPDKQPGDLS